MNISFWTVVLCIIIAIPVFFFLSWVFNVIRFVILPYKKAIKGFFIDSARTIIIIVVLAILGTIGYLIYQHEAPKLYYTPEKQYDVYH